MRIEDLCTTAPASPSRSSNGSTPYIHRPRPSASPSPLAVRLPALSALFPPRCNPPTPSPLPNSALTVTFRIPSRNRPQYTVKTEKGNTPHPPASPAKAENGEVNRDDATAVRQRTKRKRTEDVRKQESAQLQHELHDLEIQLTKLKRKTTRDSPVSPSPPEVPDLEHTRRELQLYLASLGCMLLQRVPDTVTAAPVHTYIHLSCAMEDRRRAIVHIKPEQLRLGRQLVEERSKFLDLTSSHSSNEWHTAADGDVYGLHFYVDQLRGVHSVHQAFSTALAFVSSHEVTAKRTISVVMYHDDHAIATYSSNIQIRVLLKTMEGPVIEANSVLFTKYDPNENVGLIVANYVDKDDLRPYEPTKRVRQELTAVCMLSPSPIGVIVRHWCFLRTRAAPQFLEDIAFGPFARQNACHSGDDLVSYLRDQLLASPTPSGRGTP